MDQQEPEKKKRKRRGLLRKLFDKQLLSALAILVVFILGGAGIIYAIGIVFFSFF
jgi:hypothetical protein